MATAIEFENVGKQYRLGLVSTRTLSHDLERWWTMNILHKEDPYLTIGETNDRATKGQSEYVWALRDINFKVEQGDVVGIIGRNGAGKSTLLKLLSKVTGPTTGCIRARGRIGSLLEVGTGFHGEMTGRENIYMNGAILGMTKPEIARKLDEIVDFSGCERYLDTPVKRYSSGMMVRLGFAVAAHLDPEILVVDEVLAVGDAEFQKKAIGKMKDVSRGEGRTVLFVSHNMDSVRKLCNNGVLLENGRVKMIGEVSDAINEYLNVEHPSGPISLNDFPRESCTGELHFTQVEFLDANDVPKTLQCGATCRIKIYYTAKKDIHYMHFSVEIHNDKCGTHTNLDSHMVSDYQTILKGDGYVICEIPRLPFTEGKYTINFWAGNNEGECDAVAGFPLQINGGDFYGLKGASADAHMSGYMLVDHRWIINGRKLENFVNEKE